MKKTTKYKRILAVILSAVLLILRVQEIGATEADKSVVAEDGISATGESETKTLSETVANTVEKHELSIQEEAALGEMSLVAESEALELYLDYKETDFMVRDKASGNVWFSNPVDTDEDTFSTAYYQKVLKAQIFLTYINENTQVSTMNNYTAAIENGQFEIEEVENGVKITYMIGEHVTPLLLPEAISEERMEGFLEKMPEDQQKKIKRNYTLNEDGLYVLRGGVKDYLKEELAEYFVEAGYTEEDYALDGENAIDRDTQEDVWFQIPVTYQLDGKYFVASIDPEEISYNDDGYYLVNVDLLRYFGASLKEDGYMLVPDGSGALIHFNNGKTDVAAYGAQVYGQDKTMLSMSYYESQVDGENTIKMPVFGIKDQDKAMFSIIEEGDGYATISADVAGKITGYNDVYASFSYLQYGSASLDDIVGANSYYMYSEPKFEGSYRIRYGFLSGEKADYSGMAELYREYLQEQGVLSEKLTEEELPFYVEYIGAIDKPKTFLGIKYDAVETLTSFSQAEEITALLTDGGVKNIHTIYSGWMNGGLHGTAATKLNLVKGLEKDGVSLKQFQEDMKELENELFMTVDFQYVYQDKWFDGYSTMKYAPRYFDNTTATVLKYGLASRVSEGTLANLISPFYEVEIASKMAEKLAKKNVTGVNLGTLSGELYSDFDEKNYTDRQMAISSNTEAMEALMEQEIKLLGDNANAYTWGYAEDIVNVPLSSNFYKIIDEEIPFYEMVIHGYMQYAGEAMNMADDYQTTLLKSVESGAGIQFMWIYASNSVLKETEYDGLYSVNYEEWIDKAVETWNRMNQDLGALQSQEITEHEILMPKVVRVTYEDGTKVYVNYTKESVFVDGITIEAEDYAVK